MNTTASSEATAKNAVKRCRFPPSVVSAAAPIAERSATNIDGIGDEQQSHEHENG